MAKSIYLSQEEISEILTEVKEQIVGTKCYGNITVTRTSKRDDREAFIYFTQDAWVKMTALVREFDTEVEWHGCVRRISEDEFEVYDIIVPPHVVTGSTVTSDDVSYTNWINDLSDDMFEALRFHGHSHVNMGCSPSNVDMTYRKNLVTQIPIPSEEEDGFYIFLIFNKKGEWTGQIYDIKNNALYDTAEITIDVYTEDNGLLSDFMEYAKKQAVRETYKPAPKSEHKDNVNKPAPKTKKSSGEDLSWISKLFAGSTKDDISDPFFARGY